MSASDERTGDTERNQERKEESQEGIAGVAAPVPRVNLGDGRRGRLRSGEKGQRRSKEDSADVVVCREDYGDGITQVNGYNTAAVV